MRPAETLLSRLDGVRKTGRGTWRARCPSHQSKGLTLAIREREDGAVLLHCFAECSADQVVGAVGLELHNLFPPRPAGDFAPGERRPFPAADVLACLAEEHLIGWVISRDMEYGRPVPQTDFDRLTVANRRIQAGLDMVSYGR